MSPGGTGLKISLTGFESFGGSDVNPSWIAVQTVAQGAFGSDKVAAHKISLVFQEIQTQIETILEKDKPDIAICVGQSSRSSVSVERVAINLADAQRVAYNCGSKPTDQILVPGAPAAYFSTLPVRQILVNLRKEGIPAELSLSAGSFGCNQIFFHLMHYIKARNLSTWGGFIHVPSLPQQAIENTKPSMAQETTNRAIASVMETCRSEFLQQKR